MSRVVGNQLTDALLARLDRERAVEYADRAIVICTIDEHGWPHPAMVSSLELVARDARTIRLALHTGSRSVGHLRANGRLTIVFADETSVHYIKGDAQPMTRPIEANRALTAFDVHVQHVLEDNPADYERARIISGIRVDRAIDELAAGALLDELLAAPQTSQST